MITKTNTIVMLLVAIVTVGIGTAAQSAQACCGEINPSTGNPHPPGEKGNPHQSPGAGGTGLNTGCSGNPHGQHGGGDQCPGALS